MRANYCKYHVNIKQFLLDHCADTAYRSALEDECRIALVKFLLGKGGVDFDTLGVKKACLHIENSKQDHLNKLGLQGFFNAFDKQNREDSACLCCAIAIEMGEVDCTSLYGMLLDEQQYHFQHLPGVVKRGRWSQSLSEFLSQNMPLSTESI